MPVTDVNDSELDAGKAALLGLLNTKESWTDTLHRVAAVACETIPGCSSGSVTLWREDQPYTLVSTSDLAREIDEAQYETMEGPCLDASRYGRTYMIGDMREDRRWPSFCGVAAQRGALSSLSVPLTVRGESLGALNLYSVDAGAFAGAERHGEAFAKQASVAIANARVYHHSRALAERLDQALRESASVEQAKGRIMAQRGCTAAEAERILRENAPSEGSDAPTLGG